MVLQYLEPSQTLLVNLTLPGSNAEIVAAVAAATVAPVVMAAVAQVRVVLMPHQVHPILAAVEVVLAQPLAATVGVE